MSIGHYRFALLRILLRSAQVRFWNWRLLRQRIKLFAHLIYDHFILVIYRQNFAICFFTQATTSTSTFTNLRFDFDQRVFELFIDNFQTFLLLVDVLTNFLGLFNQLLFNFDVILQFNFYKTWFGSVCYFCVIGPTWLYVGRWGFSLAFKFDLPNKFTFNSRFDLICLFQFTVNFVLSVYFLIEIPLILSIFNDNIHSCWHLNKICFRFQFNYGWILRYEFDQLLFWGSFIHFKLQIKIIN